MEKIHLNEVLLTFGIVSRDDRLIKGVHDDSRCVKKDWIFVAYDQKREAYIEEALSKGAVVFCTHSCPFDNVYVVTNGKEALYTLLRLYYPKLFSNMVYIGITGTNGKSSTAYFLYQCLSCRENCLWIGTHHVLCKKFQQEIANTTPSLCTLVQLIEKGHQHGVHCVIMEVSSHAIMQERIQIIRFDYIVYTNITRDHLDYHLCEAHYRYAKYRLRKYKKETGKILVNHEDPHLKDLYPLIEGNCVTYGKKMSHFWLHDIVASASGLRFFVNEVSYVTKICGDFQAVNLSAVIAVCHLFGMNQEQIQTAIRRLQPLEGRLQKVWEHPFAFVDYAHTASACCALFESIRAFPHDRIITIIGCGGERDQEKRKEIGYIASMNSDLCIFTSDNPRREPLSQIFAMMCAQVKNNVMIFEDRTCAIKFAVKNSRNDDIILVVGKGDERWQNINGKDYPFDDAQVLRCALREKEERA